MAVNGQPMRLANRFVLVIEEFKFSTGEKSTALVVDTTVLDHWDEASNSGCLDCHEPRTGAAALVAQPILIRISPADRGR